MNDVEWNELVHHWTDPKIKVSSLQIEDAALYMLMGVEVDK
jgi:hypothetical protein